MANNLVYFDTTSNTIQQFNSTDIAKISNYILEYMAANGTFTGSITVGTSNPIGTFTDTFLGGDPYPAANSDNVTIYSTTYTLSQINTATLTAATDPPMYVGLDVTDPNTVILQENKTTLDNLADEILDRMISDYGVNSYYLGPSAPTDGGVWTNLGSLVDLTYTSNNYQTYYLWKKLNSGTYTSDYKRPLKLSSGQLLQFSDTEIQRIVKTIEQRIVATGKGLYSIGPTAPPTGTWTSSGLLLNDYRQTTQEVDFDGSSFQDGFSGPGPSYLGPLDGPSFEGPGFSVTSPYYLGASSPPYFGPPTNYTGDDAYSYISVFANPNATPFSTNYTGDNVNNFTRNFTNPNAISFSGNIDAVNYLGFNPTFTGILPNYINYVGPTGSYLGPAPYPFWGSPSGGFYGGPGTGSPPPSYLGPASYTGDYLGPASFTSSTYLGLANFTGNYQGPGNFSTFVYQGTIPDNFNFFDVYATYTATYISTNTDGLAFSSPVTYTADYTGTYTGTRVGSFQGTPPGGSSVYLWKRIA